MEQIVHSTAVPVGKAEPLWPPGHASQVILVSRRVLLHVTQLLLSGTQLNTFVGSQRKQGIPEKHLLLPH